MSASHGGYQIFTRGGGVPFGVALTVSPGTPMRTYSVQPPAAGDGDMAIDTGIRSAPVQVEVTWRCDTRSQLTAHLRNIANRGAGTLILPDEPNRPNCVLTGLNEISWSRIDPRSDEGSARYLARVSLTYTQLI